MVSQKGGMFSQEGGIALRPPTTADAVAVTVWSAYCWCVCLEPGVVDALYCLEPCIALEVVDAEIPYLGQFPSDRYTAGGVGGLWPD